MQTKPLHIIQKQVIDITLPRFETMQEWERNERRDLINAIQLVTERCFDEFDEPDRFLLMERLELDLGSFTGQTLQTEMPQRLYSALRTELIRHWKSAPDIQANERFQKENGLKNNNEDFQYSGNDNQYSGEYRWNREGNNFDHRSFSGSRGRLESLLFFLLKGYLPWWASGLADWNEAWLRDLPVNEWAELKQFFATNNNNSRLRLVTQFDNDFLATLTGGLNNNNIETRDGWNWLLKVMSTLHERSLPLTGLSHETESSSSTVPSQLLLPSIHILRQRYWSQWISHALGEQGIPRLSYIFEGYSPVLEYIQQHIQNKDFSRLSPLIHAEIPLLWQEESDQYRQNPLKENQPGQNVHLKKMINNDAVPGDNEFMSGADKKVLEDEPGKKVFIKDAGLVLLHPFLPQLFRHCGFLIEQQFPDPNLQTKSVHALNFLLTGRVVFKEYDLLLPKILCGMPWETPLEPVDPLEETHQLACEELLTAVVRHWTALRNTSPDGLREAFLQRTGRLEFLDNGWQLQVEEKTQDILLGRLPWGISVIKYPWMPAMLSVTWK